LDRVNAGTPGPLCDLSPKGSCVARGLAILKIGENYVHSRLEKRRTKRGDGGWNGWPAEYQGLRIKSAADLDEEFPNLVRYAFESYGLLLDERG